MELRTINDLGDVNGKVVMLRADLNVPVNDKFEVTNDARIVRTVPTIKALMNKGAKVLVVSHFGRPKGKRTEADSLKHLVKDLEKNLGKKVVFVDDCIGEKVKEAMANMNKDEVLLLENLRFYNEEEGGDLEFAAKLTAVADAYVSDAFSTAHRAHASMVVKGAVAGLLMEEEVNALDKALGSPARPLMAIVGGSKVSTKLDLLNNLVKKVDKLVIAGGMAHTFMKAQGIDTVNEKNSLVQMDMLDTAKEIMKTAKAHNCEIILPLDVVVAKDVDFKAAKHNGEVKTVDLEHIPADWTLLDVGAKSVAETNAKLAMCKTLVWNGPLGMFEQVPFDAATNAVAQYAAKLTKEGKLMSVGGGGDTVSALEHAGVAEELSYISTAGGAFLEWMEGKELPGVKVLEK